MPVAASRLEARLTLEQKHRLQRAAALEGRTLTDFIVRSVELAADKTIRRHEESVLNARESEAFVAALLEPGAPNQSLRDAAEHYRRALPAV
jgi:uncharacterized protein (DUF1778 family)